MPYYNMMIDSINGLDIIKEVTSKSGTDNSETKTSVENESTAHSDKRYSDTPQNHLTNIQNGEYVTEYNYDTNTDNSSTSGTGSNERTYQETVTRTPTNKIQALKEYQKEIKSIYSLIYDDLDELFYGLI
jgi:cytoskeletal protein RodZ